MRTRTVLMLGAVLCFWCANPVADCWAAKPSAEGATEKNAEDQRQAGNTEEEVSDAEAIKILHQGISLIADVQYARYLGRAKARTIVILMAYKADGGIVRSRGGTIKVFKDDLGTDLHLESRGKDHSAIEDFSLSREQDAKAITFTLSSHGLPAPGARSLTVAGTVNIEVGTLRTVEHKSVPLREGTTFTVLGKKVTVSEAETHGQIDIEWPGDHEYLHGLKFFDAQGDEIKTKRYRPDGVPTRYKLKRAVETATIQLFYWAESRIVSVPFELELTLGPDEPVGRRIDK